MRLGQTKRAGDADRAITLNVYATLIPFALFAVWYGLKVSVTWRAACGVSVVSLRCVYHVKGSLAYVPTINRPFQVRTPPLTSPAFPANGALV
jgi:hypothetical protein